MSDELRINRIAKIDDVEHHYEDLVLVPTLGGWYLGCVSPGKEVETTLSKVFLSDREASKLLEHLNER